MKPRNATVLRSSKRTATRVEATKPQSASVDINAMVLDISESRNDKVGAPLTFCTHYAHVSRNPSAFSTKMNTTLSRNMNFPMSLMKSMT